VSRGYNNCKHVCNKCWCTQFYKTNTTGHKSTDRPIKAQIDSNTITVGDVNTTLSPRDRSSRQKINKETSELNDVNRVNELKHLQNISTNSHRTHIHSSQKPTVISPK
jgi:hypothetical protein